MAKQQNAKQKKVQPMQFGATKLLEEGASRLMNLIKLGAEALTSGAGPIQSVAEALSGASSGNPNAGQMNANMEFVPYPKYTMETRSKNQSQGASPAKKSSGKKKQTGPINEDPDQGYNPLSEGIYQDLLKLAVSMPPRETMERNIQYYPPMNPQIGPDPASGGTPYPGVFMDPLVYYAPGTPGPVGGVTMDYRTAMDLQNMPAESQGYLSSEMSEAAQYRQDLKDNPERFGLDSNYVPKYVARPEGHFNSGYPLSRVSMADYSDNLMEFIADARRGYGRTIDNGTNPFFRGDK